MDTDALKLFVSVAVSGSFSRAAALSRLTQSTVSKRVLALELELGHRLLERTGRGARLTEAGRLLLGRAEALVREVDDLPSALSAELSQPQGTVRLALQASISWPLMRHLHGQLRANFPLVRLQVVEAPTRQIVELLQAGRADLAVLSHWGTERLPIAQALCSRRLVLVAPGGDGQAGKRRISYAAAAELPLIMSPMPNGARVMLEEVAIRKGIALNVVLEVHSIHLIKNLVREGMGYTIAVRDAVTEEVEAGKLAAVPIVGPQLSQQFFLSVAQARKPPGAVTVVADMVRRLMR